MCSGPTAWCKSAFAALRGPDPWLGPRGVRSVQAAELTAPGASPAEQWATTASEGVLEAANQQIQKSNKALAVIKRGR